MVKQHVYIAGDVVSALAIITTFAGLLPPLAALGAFVWYILQIYESATVRKWRRKHRAATRIRRRRRATRLDKRVIT